MKTANIGLTLIVSNRCIANQIKRFLKSSQGLEFYQCTRVMKRLLSIESFPRLTWPSLPLNLGLHDSHSCLYLISLSRSSFEWTGKTHCLESKLVRVRGEKMGVVCGQTQTVAAIDRTSKALSLSPSPEFISISCSPTVKVVWLGEDCCLSSSSLPCAVIFLLIFFLIFCCQRYSSCRLISSKHDSFSRGQFDPRCFNAVCRWSSSKTKCPASI